MNRYRAAAGIKTGTELDDQDVAWPDEAEVERELEMVGLRERTHLPDADSETSDFQEARSVGWKEVMFGRKRAKLTEEEETKAAEKEWRDGKSVPAPRSHSVMSSYTRSYSCHRCRGELEASCDPGDSVVNPSVQF